jgi:ATP-dependent Clp protease protease subunit
MPKFWNFIKNEGSEAVELRIEGEIVSDDDAWFYEWFGIPVTTPNSFREALAEYEGKDINVWIDSWGGDVFAAAGIYNALREHKGKVTTKVDGKAVSAASVVAMAGTETMMSPVSIMMIHNPWWGVQGEAKDLRHAASVLDEVKETIINAYQLKSGRQRAKIAQMMDDETWMSAKKALDEGFINGILYTDQQDQAVPQNSFMFGRMAIQNSAADRIRQFIEQNKEKLIDPPKKEEQQPGNGLLSLYQAQIQVNKNKNGR